MRSLIGPKVAALNEPAGPAVTRTLGQAGFATAALLVATAFFSPVGEAGPVQPTRASVAPRSERGSMRVRRSLAWRAPPPGARTLARACPGSSDGGGPPWRPGGRAAAKPARTCSRV